MVKIEIISLKYFSVFPEYFLALSIIYILIVVSLLIYSSQNLILQKPLSELIALVLFMSCYLMLNDDLVELGHSSFNGAIIHDSFSFLTRFIICFFSGFYFLIVSEFFKDQKVISFEYLVIVLFSILGLIVMCSSYDLLITYLALELSSLSFYVLASFKKTSSYSIESGLKYFITGAISSAFFLLGSSFVYGTLGSINFQDFYGCLRYPVFLLYEFTMLDPWFFSNYYESVWWEVNVKHSLMEVGLIFILVSLFIKLALAPFHLWSLDVYEGSPTSSTIFFAVIAKLSLFVIIIRLCYQSFGVAVGLWQPYFFLISILSIFVGSFGGLKQRKLKTLLAYSSISHTGYLLLLVGSHADSSVQFFLFYMIVYMISGLCVWSTFLFLKLKRRTPLLKYSKNVGDIVLLRKSNNSLAIAFVIIMFSLAGIPPLVGFVAKLGLLMPLVGGSFSPVNFDIDSATSTLYLGLFSVILGVPSTFYYIRLIKSVYFENTLVGKLYSPINTEKTLVFSSFVFLLIFCFLNPTFLFLICCKVMC